MKKIVRKCLIALIFLTHCADEKGLDPAVSIVANFSATNTTIKVGESISFTDLSTGGPDSWDWTFDGGEPTSSHDQNPVIRYQVPGTYRVSLSASKGNAADSEIKENFITVKEADILVGSFDLNNEITFGLGFQTDLMQAMIKLESNSFVSVGWTDGGISAEVDYLDILVTKFDKDFNLIWNKSIGGSKNDMARDIIATNDGGFLIASTTESNDLDIPENKGKGDVSLIKLNPSGDMEWSKTYGGSEYDVVNNNSLIKLENGYAVIGHTESEDANISGKVGLDDIWLFEIDNSGSILNSVAIGSAQNDYAYSAVTSNFGYVILSKIGGTTKDFDKPGIWLFEVNSTGEVGWKTFIGGVNAGKLIKTQDHGYITLNTKAANITDLFATKFNSSGVVEWEKSYPLPDQEFAKDILQIGDEYLILAGSEPYNGRAREGKAYVAKLNASGDVIQSIVFGEDKVSPCAIFKVDEGRYVLGGTKNVGQTYMDFEIWLQNLSDSN